MSLERRASKAAAGLRQSVAGIELRERGRSRRPRAWALGAAVAAVTVIVAAAVLARIEQPPDADTAVAGRSLPRLVATNLPEGLELKSISPPEEASSGDAGSATVLIFGAGTDERPFARSDLTVSVVRQPGIAQRLAEMRELEHDSEAAAEISLANWDAVAHFRPGSGGGPGRLVWNSGDDMSLVVASHSLEREAIVRIANDLEVTASEVVVPEDVLPDELRLLTPVATGSPETRTYTLSYQGRSGVGYFVLISAPDPAGLMGAAWYLGPEARRDTFHGGTGYIADTTRILSADGAAPPALAGVTATWLDPRGALVTVLGTEASEEEVRSFIRGLVEVTPGEWDSLREEVSAAEDSDAVPAYEETKLVERTVDGVTYTLSDRTFNPEAFDDESLPTFSEDSFPASLCLMVRDGDRGSGTCDRGLAHPIGTGVEVRAVRDGALWGRVGLSAARIVVEFDDGSARDAELAQSTLADATAAAFLLILDGAGPTPARVIAFDADGTEIARSGVAAVRESEMVFDAED